MALNSTLCTLYVFLQTSWSSDVNTILLTSFDHEFVNRLGSHTQNT